MHGVKRYIAWNIVPATLGNLIGGLFVVGGFLTYLYVWKQRRTETLAEWLRFNFVPTQSVRSIVLETAHQFFNDLPVLDNRADTSSVEGAKKGAATEV